MLAGSALEQRLRDDDAVAIAIAQRRNRNGYFADAIEQIGTEFVGAIIALRSRFVAHTTRRSSAK